MFIEDDYDQTIERVDRQSCYVVRADELFNEVSQDSTGKGLYSTHNCTPTSDNK